MIVAQTKENILYSVIYSESVLALDKYHKLIFIVHNKEHNFKFNLVFDFDDKGEAFSTTFWETPEDNTLVYLLHKWDSPTWVEIGKPIELSGKDLNGQYFLKFRSHSFEGSPHRNFSITVWKLIPKLETNG